MDVPLDDNCITNTCIHCHVFLDHIWSKKKLVQGLENNRQEWSIKVEQDHVVMSRGIEDRKVMAIIATW